MKIVKIIIDTILLLVITICGFGGGCLIYSFIAIILFPNINPTLNEILFFITALVPIPICWYIAPKISDKIL